MRKIIMMVMAGCMIGMLTGCGVPKEEHEAKVAELNAAWEEIETLKGKLDDTHSLLKKEQGKVRNNQIELDDASKRIAELSEMEAITATALADEIDKTAALEIDLAAAMSAIGMANDQIGELEAALAKLQGEYDSLLNRFNELKKNMLSLGGEVPMTDVEPKAAAAPKAAEEAPKSDSKTAADLLNEMGME